MITHLQGRIEEVGPHHVVMDVGGVGYEMTCSTKTLSTLEKGETTRLFTEHLVRENAQTLVGFRDANERSFYRLLVGVQGVGSRVALAMLSWAEPAQLAQALLQKDKGFLCRAEGVGPKLVARMMTELKGAVEKWTAHHGMTMDLSSVPHGSQKSSHWDGLKEDAYSALASLGYRRSDVHQVLEKLLKDGGDSFTLQDLIPVALSHLSASRKVS